MFSLFYTYQLANADESSLPGILYPSLLEISRTLPRKYRELSDACQKVVDHLKERDQKYQPGDALESRAERYFHLLYQACEVDKSKVRCVALECINKLLSYKYLIGSAEVSAKMFPSRSGSSSSSTTSSSNVVSSTTNKRSNDDDTSSGPKRHLIDVIVETLYDCAIFADDSVQLCVLKCILTAVQSSSCRVRGQSLNSAIRACTHIYVSTMVPTNRDTAKATVIQIVTLTFKRMDLAFHQVTSLSEQCNRFEQRVRQSRQREQEQDKQLHTQTPASSFLADSPRLSPSKDTTGIDDDNDNDDVEIDNTDSTSNVVSPDDDNDNTKNNTLKSNKAATTQEQSLTDGGSASITSRSTTQGIGTTTNSSRISLDLDEQLDCAVPEVDSAPTAEQPTTTTTTTSSTTEQTTQLQQDESKLRDLYENLHFQRQQSFILQADAYQILRSLGRQGIRPLADPPEPPQQRSRLLALELLLHIFKLPGQLLCSSLPFLSVIRTDVLQCLCMSLTSSVEDIFKLAAQVLGCLVLHFRAELKMELSNFIYFVLIEILRHPHSTFHHKVVILDTLVAILRDRTIVLELLLNSDLAMVPYATGISPQLHEISKRRRRKDANVDNGAVDGRQSVIMPSTTTTNSPPAAAGAGAGTPASDLLAHDIIVNEDGTVSADDGVKELALLTTKPPDFVASHPPLLIRELLLTFQQILTTNHVDDFWMTIRDDQELKSLTTECVNSIVRAFLFFQTQIALGSYTSPYPHDVSTVTGNNDARVLYANICARTLQGHQTRQRNAVVSTTTTTTTSTTQQYTIDSEQQHNSLSSTTSSIDSTNSGIDDDMYSTNAMVMSNEIINQLSSISNDPAEIKLNDALNSSIAPPAVLTAHMSLSSNVDEHDLYKYILSKIFLPMNFESFLTAHMTDVIKRTINNSMLDHPILYNEEEHGVRLTPEILISKITPVLRYINYLRESITTLEELNEYNNQLTQYEEYPHLRKLIIQFEKSTSLSSSSTTTTSHGDQQQRKSHHRTTINDTRSSSSSSSSSAYYIDWLEAKETYCLLTENKIHQFLWDSAIYTFNIFGWKKAFIIMKYFQLLDINDPRVVASWLYHTPTLTKSAIGELLGGYVRICTETLYYFMQYFDFHNIGLDDALRRLLYTFRIVGEAQCVSRLVSAFSTRYLECNPTMWNDADIPLILAFSLIMLNTDAHNDHVATKMSKQAFFNNSANSPATRHLSHEYLGQMYDHIVNSEILVKGDVRKNHLLLSNRKRLSAFLHESQEYATILQHQNEYCLNGIIQSIDANDIGSKQFNIYRHDVKSLQIDTTIVSYTAPSHLHQHNTTGTSVDTQNDVPKTRARQISAISPISASTMFQRVNNLPELVSNFGKDSLFDISPLLLQKEALSQKSVMRHVAGQNYVNHPYCRYVRVEPKHVGIIGSAFYSFLPILINCYTAIFDYNVLLSVSGQASLQKMYSSPTGSLSTPINMITAVGNDSLVASSRSSSSQGQSSSDPMNGLSLNKYSSISTTTTQTAASLLQQDATLVKLVSDGFKYLVRLCTINNLRPAVDQVFTSWAHCCTLMDFSSPELKSLYAFVSSQTAQRSPRAVLSQYRQVVAIESKQRENNKIDSPTQPGRVNPPAIEFNPQAGCEPLLDSPQNYPLWAYTALVVRSEVTCPSTVPTASDLDDIAAAALAAGHIPVVPPVASTSPDATVPSVPHVAPYGGELLSPLVESPDQIPSVEDNTADAAHRISNISVENGTPRDSVQDLSHDDIHTSSIDDRTSQGDVSLPRDDSPQHDRDSTSSNNIVSTQDKMSIGGDTASVSSPEPLNVSFSSSPIGTDPTSPISPSSPTSNFPRSTATTNMGSSSSGNMESVGSGEHTFPRSSGSGFPRKDDPKTSAKKARNALAEQNAAKQAETAALVYQQYQRVASFTNIALIQSRNVACFRHLLSIIPFESNSLSQHAWFMLLFIISYYHRIGLVAKNNQSDTRSSSNMYTTSDGVTSSRVVIFALNPTDNSPLELLEISCIDAFFNNVVRLAPASLLTMLIQLKTLSLFELFPTFPIAVPQPVRVNINDTIEQIDPSTLVSSQSSSVEPLSEHNSIISSNISTPMPVSLGYPSSPLQFSIDTHHLTAVEHTYLDRFTQIYMPTGELAGTTRLTPPQPISLATAQTQDNYVGGCVGFKQTLTSQTIQNVRHLMTCLPQPVQFLTQKYNEVMYYLNNDSHSLMFKTVLFEVILDVLRQGSCHPQFATAQFILTTLKQLCHNYLTVTTPNTCLLTSYLFLPYETVIGYHTQHFTTSSHDILDFAVLCLGQVIGQMSHYVHTGWGMILRTLQYIPRNQQCNTQLVQNSFSLLNSIITDHFTLVTTSNINPLIDLINSLSCFTQVNQHSLYSGEDDNGIFNTQPALNRSGLVPPSVVQDQALKQAAHTLANDIVIPATTLLSRTAVYISKLTLLLNDLLKQPELYLHTVLRYDLDILLGLQSPVKVNDLRRGLAQGKAAIAAATAAATAAGGTTPLTSPTASLSTPASPQSTTGLSPALQADEQYINWHNVLTLSPPPHLEPIPNNPSIFSIALPTTVLSNIPDTFLDQIQSLRSILSPAAASSSSSSVIASPNNNNNSTTSSSSDHNNVTSTAQLLQQLIQYYESNPDAEKIAVAAILQRLETSRQMLTKGWLFFLSRLSNILINHDVSVRSHALPILDKVLLHYGNLWTSNEWRDIFTGVIMPIFHYVQIYSFNPYEFPLIELEFMSDESSSSSSSLKSSGSGNAATTVGGGVSKSTLPTRKSKPLIGSNPITRETTPKHKKHVDKWIKTSLYGILVRVINLYYVHHDLVKPYLSYLLLMLFKLMSTTNAEIVRIALRSWYTLCTYPSTAALATVTASRTQQQQQSSSSSQQQLPQPVTTSEEWDQLFVWYLYVCKFTIPTALIADETRLWLGIPLLTRSQPSSPQHSTTSSAATFAVTAATSSSSSTTTATTTASSSSATTLQNNTPPPILPALDITKPSMQQVLYNGHHASSHFVPFINVVDTSLLTQNTNMFLTYHSLLSHSMMSTSAHIRPEPCNLPQSGIPSHIFELLSLLDQFQYQQEQSIYPDNNNNNNTNTNDVLQFLQPNHDHTALLQVGSGGTIATISSTSTTPSPAVHSMASPSTSGLSTPSIISTVAVPDSLDSHHFAPSAMMISPPIVPNGVPPTVRKRSGGQTSSTSEPVTPVSTNVRIDRIIYQEDIIVLRSKVLVMMVETMFNVLMTLCPQVYANSPYQNGTSPSANGNPLSSSAVASVTATTAQSTVSAPISSVVPATAFSSSSSSSTIASPHLPPHTTTSTTGTTVPTPDNKQPIIPILINDQHFLCVLDVLLYISDFASEFNNDYTLRKLLWLSGFLSNKHDVVDLSTVVNRAIKISSRLIISRLCWSGRHLSLTSATCALTRSLQTNLVHRLHLIVNFLLPAYLLAGSILQPYGITVDAWNFQLFQKMCEKMAAAAAASAQQQQQQSSSSSQSVSILPSITSLDLNDKIISGGLTPHLDIECSATIGEVLAETIIGISSHDHLTAMFLRDHYTQCCRLIAFASEPIRIVLARILQTNVAVNSIQYGIEHSGQLNLEQWSTPDTIE